MGTLKLWSWSDCGKLIQTPTAVTGSASSSVASGCLKWPDPFLYCSSLVLLQYYSCMFLTGNWSVFRKFRFTTYLYSPPIPWVGSAGSGFSCEWGRVQKCRGTGMANFPPSSEALAVLSSPGPSCAVVTSLQECGAGCLLFPTVLVEFCEFYS